MVISVSLPGVTVASLAGVLLPKWSTSVGSLRFAVYDVPPVSAGICWNTAQPAEFVCWGAGGVPPVIVTSLPASGLPLASTTWTASVPRVEL